MEQTTAGSGRCPDPKSKPIKARSLIDVEVECWSVDDAKAAIKAFEEVDNVRMKIRVLQKFQ